MKQSSGGGRQKELKPVSDRGFDVALVRDHSPCPSARKNELPHGVRMMSPLDYRLLLVTRYSKRNARLYRQSVFGKLMNIIANWMKAAQTAAPDG